MTRRLAILLLLSLTPLGAQVSAILSGTVTDASGAVVPGAEVSAKNIDEGAVRTALTGGDGRYQFLSLPAGVYEIEANKTGFSREVRAGVHLVVAGSATVDLSLKVGGIDQQIPVSADAAMVGVNTSDVAGLVGERQIKDLPLNGRSYDELITLNPGVVNFTWEKVGGAAESTMQPGGASQQLLGVDAVREFNVLTGS